jgi:DNA-binding transcriptional LysR family regulator
MNLIWFEDFMALASTGNFSRAAEERHMTQPAFSRRIRALEEWLGVVLIDRRRTPRR